MLTKVVYNVLKGKKNLIRALFVAVGGFTIGVSAGNLDTAVGMILFGVGVLLVALPNVLIKDNKKDL